MIELPSSYTEAQQAGARFFFTGRPCRRGHIALRNKWGACVECVEAAQKSERYRERARNRAATQRALNPEKHREGVRRSRLKHADKVAARLQKWRSENQAHIKEYRRKYYSDRAEELRSRRCADYHARPEFWANVHRRWCRRNPLKARERTMRRRARKLAAAGTLTAADVAEIIKMQRGRCAECGKRRKLTVDHIIALSKGGTHHRWNIQMLCKPCNSEKKDRDPIEYAQRKGRLL